MLFLMLSGIERKRWDQMCQEWVCPFSSAEIRSVFENVKLIFFRNKNSFSSMQSSYGVSLDNMK